MTVKNSQTSPMSYEIDLLLAQSLNQILFTFSGLWLWSFMYWIWCSHLLSSSNFLIYVSWADLTFDFLVERWVDQLPPGLQLKEASVDPPSVEDACRCHFIFAQDHGLDAKLVLQYQWYLGDRALSDFVAIPEATSEVTSWFIGFCSHSWWLAWAISFSTQFVWNWILLM